jgi:hypothetical protein
MRASGPVFIFFSSGTAFGGTEGARCRFHIVCSPTRFRRYRGRRVPFSCFALPDPFSAVPRAPGPRSIVFRSGHVLGGIEGAGSRFHVLRSRTRFRRYRWRWEPFSYFSFPDTFWAILRAPGPVFMFYRGRRFDVLHSLTSFRRYRGRRVPFTCFALPNSFSAVP